MRYLNGPKPDTEASSPCPDPEGLEMIPRTTGCSRRRFLRRLGYGTLGGVIALWTAHASALVLRVPRHPIPRHGTKSGGTGGPARISSGLRPGSPVPNAQSRHQPGSPRPGDTARVVSGLTPQQATVRASRMALVRPEEDFLHGFPELEAARFHREHRDASLDRYVRNSPTNATAPCGLKERANVDEELCKAWDELSRAVEGCHPSGRKITPEQAALRLLLLLNIRDSGFKLPNRHRGRPEFPLETLQSAADYQLLWSRSAPPNVCVWCNPLSRIFPIKANIDLAGEDRAKLAKLDEALKAFWTTKGKNPFLRDVPGEPKDTRKGFQKNELLPGDQIWFENPYAKLIDDAEWKAQGFQGEEGSNVFYLGDGKVINIYHSHPIKTIEEKQKSMMGGSDWPSVDYAVAEQQKNPEAYERMIQDLDREHKDEYTKLELFPVHREVFRVLVQREPDVCRD